MRWKVIARDLKNIGTAAINIIKNSLRNQG